MQLQIPFDSLLPLGASMSAWASGLFGGFQTCPPLPAGDLTLRHYQLYPEQFEWDEKRCVAYISNLFNATLSVYDPYRQEITKIVEFPGYSHPGHIGVAPFHASGLVLRPDSKTADLLEVIIDNGDAFESYGENVAGPDFLFTLDLKDNLKIISKINLNEVSNGTYAGYADAELSEDGNTYIVGSYVSNLLRVTPQGDVSTFYVLDNLGPPREYGFTGLTTVGPYVLSNDNPTGQLVRLDTRDEKPTPVVIPHTPYHDFKTSNTMNFPKKYNETILLMAENTTPEHKWGGVGVYRFSNRLYDSAEYLGFIPSPIETALATSARQMANRIYMVVLPIDGVNIFVSGHCSEFVFQDITDKIEALMT